jgi:hypothetical protein
MDHNAVLVAKRKAREAAAAGLAATPENAHDASVPGAGDMAKKPAAAKGDKASEESGVRWKTFNAFAEHVQPHLPGAVVKVWNYLFFRAYRNTVKLSERHLAAAAGVNKDTAGLALRTLVSTGLARVNYKSKAEGAPSEYWLNPRPASCLESVLALKAKKPDRRKGNRHPNRGKKPPGNSVR